MSNSSGPFITALLSGLPLPPLLLLLQTLALFLSPTDSAVIGGAEVFWNGGRGRWGGGRLNLYLFPAPFPGFRIWKYPMRLRNPVEV